MDEAYADIRNAHTRAELMWPYDGFARMLALRCRHTESVEDLVQVARMGLFRAIDRFDPNWDGRFPAERGRRIVGCGSRAR